MNIQRAITAIAITITGLLASACSSSGGDADENAFDSDQIQHELGIESDEDAADTAKTTDVPPPARPEDAPSKSNEEITPVPTTIAPQVPTTLSLEEATRVAEGEAFSNLSKYVQALPYEECLEFDHFTASGLDENETPRIDEDGAEYTLSCETFWSGWLFDGGESHRWDSTLSAEDMQLVQGSEELRVDLPIGSLDFPDTLIHPGYSDLNPITAGEILPGTKVCSYSERADEAPRSRLIIDVHVRTYYSASTGEVSANPAFNYFDLDNGNRGYEYFTDFGFIPAADGLWLSVYGIRGECPPTVPTTTSPPGVEDDGEPNTSDDDGTNGAGAGGF